MRYILWFFFAGILVTGCRTESDNANQTQSQTQKSQNVHNFFRLEETKRCALLSAKYNLDTLVVVGIIEDYLREQDFGSYLVSTTLQGREPESSPKETLTAIQTIDQLSTKYSVARATVASIIIDYKLLKLSTQRDNSE